MHANDVQRTQSMARLSEKTSEQFAAARTFHSETFQRAKAAVEQSSREVSATRTVAAGLLANIETRWR